MREGRLGYNCENGRYGLLSMEWYLVGTPYCGNLEYVRARIPE